MTSNALEMKSKLLSQAYKNLHGLALTCFAASSTTTSCSYSHYPTVITVLLLLNKWLLLTTGPLYLLFSSPIFAWLASLLVIKSQFKQYLL